MCFLISLFNWYWSFFQALTPTVSCESVSHWIIVCVCVCVCESVCVQGSWSSETIALRKFELLPLCQLKRRPADLNIAAIFLIFLGNRTIKAGYYGLRGACSRHCDVSDIIAGGIRAKQAKCGERCTLRVCGRCSLSGGRSGGARLVSTTPIPPCRLHHLRWVSDVAEHTQKLTAT